MSVDLDVLRQLSDPTGGYSQLVALSADLSSTVIHIVDDDDTDIRSGG